LAEDRIQGFNINSNGYGTIPKSVMQDQELSISAKAVYAYFSSYTGAGDTCFPTRNKICYDLGISNNSLTKYLKELTTNGYLKVEQIKESGRFSHNVYTLPDIKLPQTKITDTQNLVDGNLHTKKNSIKTNSSSKRNSSKSLLDILYESGYDCTVTEIDDLGIAINNFVEFRKGIKKPMTDYAVELMVKKLSEMSKCDMWISVDILNQSIMNGWQGIFPLKQEKAKTVPDNIKNRVSNVDNW
jgi:hypothetical protein